MFAATILKMSDFDARRGTSVKDRLTSTILSPLTSRVDKIAGELCTISQMIERQLTLIARIMNDMPDSVDRAVLKAQHDTLLSLLTSASSQVEAARKRAII